MDGKKTMSQQVEYKFLRLNTHHRIPKTRNTVLVYLGLFHIAFIALYAFFARYKLDADKTKDDVPRMYSSKQRIVDATMSAAAFNVI
jgi:hypothetical protein